MRHRIYSIAVSAGGSIRDFRGLETDVLIFLFARTVAGLALAMVLGYVGIVAANIVINNWGFDWPEGLVLLVWYSGGGLAAGVGSFVAWIPTGTSRLGVLLIFLVVLLAAVGGAWGGYYI